MRNALAILATLWLAAAGAEAQKVGFLDFEKVFNEYKKTLEITEEMQKSIQALQEKLRLKQDELRLREESLQAEEGNSLEYLRLRRQITIEKIEAEEEFKNQIRAQQTRLVNHLKLVYKEVRLVIAGVAADQSLDAVFLMTSGEIEGRDQREVVAEILTRPVLYHRKDLDITKEVIERLNR